MRVSHMFELGHARLGLLHRLLRWAWGGIGEGNVAHRDMQTVLRVLGDHAMRWE